MQALGQFQAGHARHVDVEQGQVRFALGDHLQRHFGRIGQGRLVAGMAQDFAEEFQQELVIVNDQDKAFRGGWLAHG